MASESWRRDHNANARERIGEAGPAFRSEIVGIGKAPPMLGAAWVLYKIDGRVDHDQTVR